MQTSTIPYESERQFFPGTQEECRIYKRELAECETISVMIVKCEDYLVIEDEECYSA